MSGRKHMVRKSFIPPAPNSDLIFPTTGDVVYVNALGKSFIILGSEEAASDLLDKRSANYSDRPQFPMQDL